MTAIEQYIAEALAPLKCPRHDCEMDRQRIAKLENVLRQIVEYAEYREPHSGICRDVLKMARTL